MHQIRITTNIKQIIANKIERMKATFVCNGKECFYLYNGDKIKPLHFELTFPIEPETINTLIN